MSPEDFAELHELCHLDWLLRRRAAAMTRRVAECSGKHRFASWEAASGAIRNRETNPYHCRTCGGWHIGSRETSRQLRLAGERMRCSR